MFVRLADGQWMHLLVYRIMDRGEHSGLPAAPQTRLYVEEVVSSGPEFQAGIFLEAVRIRLRSEVSRTRFSLAQQSRALNAQPKE